MQDIDRRDFVSAAALTLFGLSTVGNAGALKKTSTKVFECTFLKSVDANPERLVKFLVANWFAMDKIAVEKGLMTEYHLFESSNAQDSWNIVVAVGYPTERGYEAITAEFEKIRKAHKKVLIDGLDLKDLGKIVESRKLFSRASSL